MKIKFNIIILISFIFILSNCASKPDIIREMNPIQDENYSINKKTIKAEKDDIIITVRYMDKIELSELAKDNNPYMEGDTPLLTAFKITIKNKRKAKIGFDLKNAVILDGQGHQFQALTYESFKSLYPSTIYQQYEYSYVFERYSKQSVLTDDYHKRKKAAKTLFKGGKIYPGVTIEGILPFERLSTYAREISLILSDIILYKAKADTDKDSKTKTEKEIEFKFKFRQKIVRLTD